MAKFGDYVGLYHPSETIEAKKLYESAIMPTRGSEYAAGLDLYACGYENNMTDGTDWSVFVNPGDTIKINTGIAVAIPELHFGGIYARSGLACKNGLAPANKVGIIDSDYRGELIVCLYNQSSVPQKVSKGDRIAQLIIQAYVDVELVECEKLDETERGEGGFGSTGMNVESSDMTVSIQNLDIYDDLGEGKLCSES